MSPFLLLLHIHLQIDQLTSDLVTIARILGCLLFGIFCNNYVPGTPGLLLGALPVALRRILFILAFILALAKRWSLCRSELLISIIGQFTIIVVTVQDNRY